jgi:hypothetical protein
MSSAVEFPDIWSFRQKRSTQWGIFPEASKDSLTSQTASLHLSQLKSVASTKQNISSVSVTSGRPRALESFQKNGIIETKHTIYEE